MIKQLQDWVENNLLIVDEITDEIYRIKDVGVFLLLRGEERVFFDNEMNFTLLKREIKLIEQVDIDHLLFEFGERYYYTKFDTERFLKNKVLKVAFDDFKYLGKAKQVIDSDFCHLGIHSEYELLNGSRTVEDWIKKADFFGHKSLGICDKNTLGGVLAFQTTCVSKGIKPIIGETVDIAYSFNDAGEAETYEGVLYVISKDGWRSILRVNKAINVDNDGYIVEKELLKLGKGLIFVFNKESVINKMGDVVFIKKKIKRYKEHFEEVYYQVDSVEYYDDDKFNEYATALRKYLRYYSDFLEPVLINDSYYLDKEEAVVRMYLNEVKRVRTALSHKQHYKNLDETYNSFLGLYEIGGNKFSELFVGMLKNTTKIAEKCNYKIDVGEHKLPKFEYDKEFDGDNVDLFFKLLDEGFKVKIKKDKKEYFKRLELEAEVIVTAGFVDYFLILWDIIKWAKEHDIIVGNARGSVAGSLIAFLLDITTVDPIKHDLIFERFLNKTRALPEVFFEVEMENGKKYKIPEEVILNGKKIEKFIEGEDLSEDFIENNLCQYQL